MSQPLKLQTKNPKLTLRQLLETDAETFYNFVQENYEHLSQHEDETPAKFQSVTVTERIISSLKAGGSIQLGIWQAEMFIGVINLKPPKSRAVEIGYAVAKKSCRQGVATAVVKRVVAYLHLNDYERVVAYAHERNSGSQGVLKKAGFDRERSDRYGELRFVRWL